MENVTSGGPNPPIIVEPEKSVFANIKLDPEMPDSVARLTVFHWVAAIFLILLGLFVLLNILSNQGNQGAAEKVYSLLDKYFVVFAGAVGFYLKERMEKK